jgi:hypothetical protein
MEYSQAGSRSRGFLRFLQHHMLIRPQTIQVPCRLSKHDATRTMKCFSVVSPMKLALALREKAPELLFLPLDQQQHFMDRFAPWALMHVVSMRSAFA